MSVHRLQALAVEHLAAAKAAPSARSAVTLIHQGPLRQTLMALPAGSALHEHEAPLAATLQILHGHARLTTAEDSTDLHTGELVTIPQRRHGLDAIDDTVVLLTVLAE